MSNENNIHGIGPFIPKSNKLPEFKLEIPQFKPIFEFKKQPIPIIENFNKIEKTEKPDQIDSDNQIDQIGQIDKDISKELHDSWTKVFPELSQEFFDELTDIAEEIKCNPEDLAAIIFRESRFDPKASGSGVYGLIQMDQNALNNAIKYGNLKKISMSAYKNLPREKQLKYAKAYIQFRIDEKKLTGKKLNGGQVWTLIKRPSAINNNR